MDWQCGFYDGNLQNYIYSFCKLMMELDEVSIVVPNKLLSYSLLVKRGVLKYSGLPDEETSCLTCSISESHRLPFTNHFISASLPMDNIHIDVVGSITPESASGFRFLITIVDEATLFKIIRFLKTKSESFDQFAMAKTYMDNGQNQKMRKLISDIGVIYNLKRQRDWKLSSPGQEGILLGFENEGTAYPILRLDDFKVVVTRKGTFNKRVFPSIPGRTNSVQWMIDGIDKLLPLADTTQTHREGNSLTDPEDSLDIASHQETNNKYVNGSDQSIEEQTNQFPNDSSFHSPIGHCDHLYNEANSLSHG
ncbi:hypothetical protein O181_042332 [Austropuccinia psidii MF-1]|uniref:Uncharacterized protein n=1 Tax=Austropuccinia psidii MF-1 TaxID=1389203 RepID=A0A9Q3HFS5_9BASI|nr:hypothetical protein [Austropuccinia psidii MF-1]